MVSKKAGLARRSGCPLNASVEMLGDHWSLLIIRDMMLQGARAYKTFLKCYEGIATNILADRLRKLTARGTGGHAKKTSHAQQKAAIRGLTLAFGLAPGVATQAGGSAFFGRIASSVDPANSFLKRRTPPTPRSGT
jgi:hypothetical protein